MFRNVLNTTLSSTVVLLLIIYDYSINWPCFLYRPFEEQTHAVISTEPVSSSLHQEENGNSAALPKGSKDSNNKKREETKSGPKKPKEKVDAISQFDLNNYASTYLENLFKTL